MFQVYIHDSSLVPNYPLLFFGEKLNYDSQTGVINVDGFVKVRSSQHVARLVQVCKFLICAKVPLSIHNSIYIYISYDDVCHLENYWRIILA